MKSTVLFCFPLFLATAISCNRQSVDAPYETDGAFYSDFVLYASQEQLPKSAIADEYGALTWNKGDEIIVFDNTGEHSIKMVTRDEGPSATFKSASPFSSSGEVYALYPYNTSSAVTGDGILSSCLPEIQTAIQSSFDPNSFLSVGKGIVSEDSNTEVSVNFKNVCGGLRFTLASDDIVSVRMEGNSSEILAGNFEMDINGGLPLATPSIQGSTSVSLTSDVPLLSSVENETAWYYITVLPQVLEKGFNLTFVRRDGSTFHTVCLSPVTVSRSRFSSIRLADRQESLDAVVTGKDLSVDGTHCANCYIVSNPGYYKIPLVHTDNPTKSISGPHSCNVIWETFNTATNPAPMSLVDRLVIKGQWLYFRVLSGQGGNALLSVQDSEGKILWSWHIWVCNNYNPDYGSIPLNGTHVLMDRNLGALSSSSSNPLSCGLLYQWGKKDPFPGAVSLAGGQMRINWEIFYKENSFLNNVGYFQEYPWHFGVGNDWLYTSYIDGSLWSDSKAKAYDPCPYGWKVPSAETFANFESGWFPYCGYLSKEGQLTGCGNYAKIWTSSPDGTKSSSLDIYSNNPSEDGIASDFRSEGHSVRCVKQL